LSSIEDLNENEQEHIEEYQELLIDGSIFDKERKMLNRMATGLDIPEERVSELETIYT